MTNKIKTFNARSWGSIVGVLALICAASVAVIGQTPSTAGGTTISSTATSSYSDGTDTYATKSITVSVAAGLTISPDAGTSDSGPRPNTRGLQIESYRGGGASAGFDRSDPRECSR